MTGGAGGFAMLETETNKNGLCVIRPFHRAAGTQGGRKKTAMDEWILITSENLPTLPHVASQLLSTIRDPLSTQKDVEKIIEMDLSLTQHLLHMAGDKLTEEEMDDCTVHKAIETIGFNRVKNLVLIATTKSVLDAGGETAKNLWAHSYAVALCSRLLAGILGLKHPDRFFLAGLFHDIGKVLITNQKPERYHEIVETAYHQHRSWSDVEKEVFKFSHEEVGVLILQKWNMPEYLVLSSKYHHMVQKENCESISNTEIPAVVSTADLIANMLTLGLLTSVPSDPLSSRSSRILGLTETQLLEVIAELPEKVMTDLELFDASFFETSPVLRVSS